MTGVARGDRKEEKGEGGERGGEEEGKLSQTGGTEGLDDDTIRGPCGPNYLTFANFVLLHFFLLTLIV